MKRLLLTTAIVFIGILAQAQDYTFTLKIQADGGSSMYVIIEDVGNRSYLTISDVSLEITNYKETPVGIHYFCNTSDGVFSIDFDLVNSKYLAYTNNEIFQKGKILFTKDN